MEEISSNGAVGALLGEYNRAIKELCDIISGVSNADLVKIIDPETHDEDCRSIQSILSHVVQSGYTYVVEIRKWLGEEVTYRGKRTLDSAKLYQIGLLEMLEYNSQLFSDHPNLTLECHEPREKIKVRWGQLYDVEQLSEHAIVHVLRHARQIQRFKKIIGSHGF